MEETLGKLSEARIFNKLDANMGFCQIPLSEDSAKHTTFITHFRCLPFGIASAPSTSETGW